MANVTIQDVQNLIESIKAKQDEMIKEMSVINISNRWVSAARRARKLSLALDAMYKEYRKLSVELSKSE